MNGCKRSYKRDTDPIHQKKNNYPKRIQKEMFGEKMFFQKCSFRVIGTSVGSSWAAS